MESREPPSTSTSSLTWTAALCPGWPEGLKNAFYVDEEMIVDAVERRASFNVIHLQTMIKLDVFVLKAAVFRGRSSW